MRITVSDHAVLRYLQRVEGIDVEGLREKMRQRALRGAQAAEQIGGGSYVINDNGVRMRVIGSHVVTVLTPKEKP